jgi:hypothetical protein
LFKTRFKRNAGIQAIFQEKGSAQIQNEIKEIISDDNKTILFDIGYEGKSLEALFKLIDKK